MKTLTETLKEIDFKPITDFSSMQQKQLFSTLHLNLNEQKNIIIYAKITERIIEFSDNDNIRLWTTKLSLTSFVILNDKYELYDKFIVPTYPFRIRNQYETTELNNIYETLETELQQFDQFIPETEEQNIYEC